MATEFDDTSSIQEVPIKASDNWVVSQDIEFSVHPSNPYAALMTITKKWDDDESRTVDIRLSRDDLWEHIHNCLHALNALKEGK